MTLDLSRLSDTQLQQLTVQELNTVIRGIGALIQELRAPEYETRNFIVFNCAQIRNTANHNGDLFDLQQADRFGFQIINSTNQILTLRVLGGLNNSAAVAPMGDPVQISANSEDCLFVPRDLWLPWVSARASFTTAPTSGAVTVILCRRERKWAA